MWDADGFLRIDCEPKTLEVADEKIPVVAKLAH